jgi:hypothetical protein
MAPHLNVEETGEYIVEEHGDGCLPDRGGERLKWVMRGAGHGVVQPEIDCMPGIKKRSAETAGRVALSKDRGTIL